MKEPAENVNASSSFLKTDGGKTKSNAIEVPSIALPKGGGALKGIDEKFEVNAANGTAGFSIPLPLSSGRNGFAPSLSLSYNSGGGNGIFGLGWGLGLPSIQRKTDKRLPRYRDGLEEDVFMFSGAEDLTPYLVESTPGQWIPLKSTTSDAHVVQRYIPRVEGGFSRIEKISHATLGVYWKVTTRDNTSTIFGRSQNARIADPADLSRTYEWLPEFSYDDKGNWIRYSYKAENLDNMPHDVHEKNRVNGGQPFVNRYLKNVVYGNRKPYYVALANCYDPLPPANEECFFELVFDFGEHDNAAPNPNSFPTKWACRQDAFSTYRAGFEMRTYRFCKRVLMFHHFEDEEISNGVFFGKDYLVRSLDFEYQPSSINNSGQTEATYLKSITQSGYIRISSTSYSKKSLPQMEFEYQGLHWDKELRTVDRESIVNAPVGLTNNYQWVDIYGEGIPGILTEQGDAWYYKCNYGDAAENGQATFGRAQKVAPKPSFGGLSSGVLSLQDLESNGQKQVVVNGPGMKGFYELTNDENWKPFQPFERTANIDFQDANTRLVDIDGDGQPEIVISEENIWIWYPADGKKGYKPAEYAFKSFDEEKGPAIVFADPKQTIFLADMSGDGLTDIVRIRNGEICYWANMGYGKFSAKIAMSNSPLFDAPDQFDPRYLHLADVSGTGATDILYLGKNKFKAFINLSGNAWSDAHEIEPFFPIDTNSQISAVDLLGTGTTCIVWSSDLPAYANAPMRYIDLMDSKKPHVLVSYKNNLGKETKIAYKSSTHYYIKDKLAGKPWITKLPFAVQVVSKLTVEEKITDVRFSTEYRYHHGYYDHPEREFRGFGVVEQIDSEHYETWLAVNATNKLENAEELYQQPVLTKTWFHTGAFLDRERILTHFENEYWQEEYNRLFPSSPLTVVEPRLKDASIFAASTIQDPNVLNSMSADEWREALRACKGMTLRQEVFALDADNAIEAERKRQAKPFSVATHNCRIQMLQPRTSNPYGVFMVTESEAITIQYERNEEDPRIAHNLNIKLDGYGNVLESAAVVYPRKIADATLPPETRDAQALTTIIFTQNQFTNDVIAADHYRLRLPYEVKTYELKGVAKTAGSLYAVSDFVNILGNSVGVEYHEVDNNPTSGFPEKRLIEHVRTVFYKDDLTNKLALGILEFRALPYESYQLAFTPELLANIFGAINIIGSKVSDGLMLEGKFTHFKDENDIEDLNWWVRSGTTQFIEGSETVANAKDRFFAPISYTDAYGAITKVKYHGNYFLFVEETEDAIGNKAKVERFDFRTLSPKRMRDPNSNLSEALVDELGLVKAMAVFGKGTEADDLSLQNEVTDAMESAAVADFFNAPDSTTLTSRGKALLQHTTARFVYDFDAYKNTGKPAVVAAIVREEHFQKNSNSPVQLSFEYSNGLGQVVMKKVQAEPGLAKKVIFNPTSQIYTVKDLDTANLIDEITGLPLPKQLRWIGNGRMVLNNKGNPVKQYEPYFSVSHQYEDLPELVETGVTPILYYDSLGRLIKTVMTDGTFSKTEFNPWKQAVYDPNDTVKESTWYTKRKDRLIDAKLVAEGKDPAKEALAALKAAKHADTPTVHHLDALGRPVLSVEHNRDSTTNADVFYKTKVHLDTEGNLRSVLDARENEVMQYKYDMLGNRVYQKSMDAGQRWLLANILGNPLRTWDERNHEFQYFYDTLHRPTHSKVIGGDGNILLDHVFERVFYGESLLTGIRTDTNRQNEAALQAQNVLGQVIQHYDTGGLMEMPEYDFKGQPKSTKRKLFSKYKEVVNWIPANLTSDLEAGDFIFTTETDALGRISQQIAPDGSVITPSYNEAGLLDGETVLHPGATTPVPYLKDIDYNEKGQRERIKYGNDVITKFYYDKETFRLKRLESKRGNNDPLQDLYYTFDAVGNMTHLEDKNIPTVFFNNQKITGTSEYTYDALYRLTEASGRENNQPLNFDSKDNWHDSAYAKDMNPSDTMAMRKYVQTYQYDAVGNILQMKHEADQNNWKRDYDYEAANNRLKSTKIGSETYTYKHHTLHGFMTEMPHLEDIGLNFKEEVVKTIRQRVSSGNGTPETTYYQYDGQGQRIRKITENFAAQGNTPSKKEERIYIAGYELYKKHSGTDAGLERRSLSLLDGGHRFVMVETSNEATDNHLVRYQLHNHLGSAALELDNSPDAKVISYEEYHPYGTTAFQARNATIKAAAKRYRYTGMERDEETGMEYHSARYYLPWLGRWCSADPIGMGDGVNLYGYGKGNPVKLIDKTGEQSHTNGKEINPIPVDEAQRAGVNQDIQNKINLFELEEAQKKHKAELIQTIGYTTEIKTMNLMGDKTITTFSGFAENATLEVLELAAKIARQFEGQGKNITFTSTGISSEVVREGLHHAKHNFIDYNFKYSFSKFENSMNLKEYEATGSFKVYGNSIRIRGIDDIPETIVDQIALGSIFKGLSIVKKAGISKTFGIGYSQNYGAAVSRWKGVGINPVGYKHHWLISQSMMKQYPFLKPFGNQLWNLKSFSTQASHMRWAHGQNYLGSKIPFSGLAYPISSTPNWFRFGGASIGIKLLDD